MSQTSVWIVFSSPSLWVYLSTSSVHVVQIFITSSNLSSRPPDIDSFAILAYCLGYVAGILGLIGNQNWSLPPRVSPWVSDIKSPPSVQAQNLGVMLHLAFSLTPTHPVQEVPFVPLEDNSPSSLSVRWSRDPLCTAHGEWSSRNQSQSWPSGYHYCFQS